MARSGAVRALKDGMTLVQAQLAEEGCTSCTSWLATDETMLQKQSKYLVYMF